MEMIQLLGADVRRACADRLHLLPRRMLYSEDAAGALATDMKQDSAGNTALLLHDRRTFAAAAGPCLDAFKAAGWLVRTVEVPDGPGGASPVCDLPTKVSLEQALPDADVYVAIGSGVVNDLTKWLAGDGDKPYAVFATAASMNGYAAANVAATIQGVKSLSRARAPRIIAADPRVIRDAPPHMTTAGLGDLIAKPVSTADWLVNHLIFDEPYCPEIAGVIDRLEPGYTRAPQHLCAGDPTALRDLFTAIVLSGCAMTLQGSSLPASGGEHLISHTLDMKSHVEGTRHDLHDLHGRQVGVATIFAAAVYERIFSLKAPQFNPGALAFEKAYWGPLGDAVQEQYASAQSNARRAASWLRAPGRWQALRKTLQPVLRCPGDIKSCLRSAGGAHRVQDLGINRDIFVQAVHHAPCMRGRFTSLDLGYLVGILPNAIDEIVDEWLMT